MRDLSRRAFLAQGGVTLAAAQLSRSILTERFPTTRLSAVLLPRAKWKPFPTAAERAAWESLPADARQALVAAGERHLGSEWPVLPATVFLEYVRNGNRSHYERLRYARRDKLRDLVIAECVEGKGRFVDDAVNGIWTTCEETFWGVPAHLGMQKARTGLPDVTEPIVDLFAAETSSLLAWTDYLIGPRLAAVNPLIRPRIQLEVDRRILTPNLERDDFSWMGLKDRTRPVNNWNPWINSNWLTSTLLLERDEKRRVAAVQKIMRSLDRFLAGYYPDGGCDEGPSYWGRAGASLFDCLELLQSASGGAMQFYDVPLVREIGRYIYRAHICDDYFLNFADAPGKLNLPGDLVFRYGRRIGDEKMQLLGAYAAHKQGGESSRSESIGRMLPALFNLATLRAAPARQPLVRDAWMPGIQVMAARIREGSPDGLYLAAQGGHNAESHNHNDVGNFVVYSNGRPVIIDVGVETYTAKTFSAQRYDIWTMQSAYHNLPTIDGVMQAAGRQFAASEVSYEAGDRAAEFRLNIAHAYQAEAGLRFWNRVLRLDRAANRVEVRDSYALNKPARRITLTLMTPCKVVARAPGDLALDDVRISYDKAFSATTEEIKLSDTRLRGVWGDKLYRVLLTAENPPAQATWTMRIG